MADTRASANNESRNGEDLARLAVVAAGCPGFGAWGDTPSPGGNGATTDLNDEMPPAPRPLPDAVAQMAAGLLVAPERAGPVGLPVVAGYELLAPLGRGGMGVVYQARQVNSGRLVALKLILGGAHARSRDLARFRTEAQAVAKLVHPNIVQIHEVGEEGGWAYFALEYVSGGSLAKHLTGQPQPPLPSARLVETLAQAMAYAHEQGVLHRDLKPGNILLADGIPKVTDFGLAKRLDLEPGASSPDPTRTGEVLGTPSYMAPEQTFGRPEEVGPSADVYALGAILYECLTGRPPFQGATPLDTLLQVRGEDPVPPRRLVPSVPRDLDTICLKCLQKEPRRRYASAADLAADLGRYLAGEGIVARPPSAWERTVRWARRRKAVAALMVVSVVAILGLLTLGVWHQIRLAGYNAELSTERDTAEDLRKQAQAQEAEARQQKIEAETHFRSALAAVKKMLVRVSEEGERLAHEPRMELVRIKLLEDALGFYLGFLKERPRDQEVRWETASTYLRIGDMRKRLGQQGAAEEAYNAGISLFEGLAEEFPRQAAFRHELAGCYTNLGSLLAYTPRQADAERAFRHAADIQQSLVTEFPTSAMYRSALAGSEHNLGTLFSRARRLLEAEQMLRRALEHRQRLADEFPSEAYYRQDLARTLNNLADVLELTGRRAEAESAFRHALELQRRLAEEFPRDPSYRLELAGSHQGLGNVLDNTGRFEEAEKEYNAALALQDRLAQEFPRVVIYRQELAKGHYNLATLLERTRPGEAEKSYRRAHELLHRLLEESPGVPAYLNQAGRTASSLADLLLKVGRPAEARELSELAVRRQHEAVKLLPRHPAYRRALGQHHQVLAEALLKLGDHAAAAQTMADMTKASSPDARVSRFAAGVLARCIPLAEQDAKLPTEQQKTLAKVYGDKAIALLRNPRPSGPNLEADPNLAALRPRADFQELLREEEKPASPMK